MNTSRNNLSKNIERLVIKLLTNPESNPSHI